MGKHPFNSAVRLLIIGSGIVLATFFQDLTIVSAEGEKESTGKESWSISKTLGRLDDPDWRVAADAERELEKRCTRDDVPSLAASLGSHGHTFNYYVKITQLLRKFKDKRAVPALSDALISSKALNFAAGTALMELGREDILIEKLNSENLGLVFVSLYELGRGKAKAAVIPVSRLLSHKDSKIREKAITVLGEIGDPAAIDPLLPILGDQDFKFRKPAIWALSHFKDRKAVQALVELLRYKSLGWKRDQGYYYQDAVEAAQALYKNVGSFAVSYLEEKTLRDTIQDWFVNWILDDIQQSSSSLKRMEQDSLNDCILNYKKYIADGDQSKIILMLALLRISNHEGLATDFLNSDCPELMTAAKYWAYRHNYQIQTLLGNSGKGPKWGDRGGP